MTSSSTITRLDRPPRDPDPDYDELWELAGKLSAMLTATVVSGVSVDAALAAAGLAEDEVAALGLTRREVAVLGMVDRCAPTLPVPAVPDTVDTAGTVGAFLAGLGTVATL